MIGFVALILFEALSGTTLIGWLQSLGQ